LKVFCPSFGSPDLRFSAYFFLLRSLRPLRETAFFTQSRKARKENLTKNALIRIAFLTCTFAFKTDRALDLRETAGRVHDSRKIIAN
jgi:hypothetical protein